jgi:hypothetical protein
MKILASIFFMALALSGRAQTSTWTGADASGYWSAPANWSPPGVPVNGNDLVFPGGLPPADMVSTNDLSGSFFRSITFGGASRHTIRGNPMTLTNRADCIINSGTNVIACDLTFSGTPAIPPYPVFGTITIRGTFNTGELTLSGNVAGGSLIPYGNRLVLGGQFSGGSIRSYAGDLALYGDNPYGVTAEFKNGTLFLHGSQPNLNLQMLWEFESAACPYLRGDGVIGDVLGCGHIVLDSTLSVKSLGGPGASQASYRVLDIHLNGTNVGEYGRLISSGDVTLTGGSLSASPGFHPQPGQVFTIINKTSPGPITTLPGYSTAIFGPEGTIITLNGMPFRLSYVGGDGNDVTLTANTPPVVTWQQPANNAAFPPGFTLSLRARATDSDGTVTNVEFFVTPTNGPTINLGQGTLASDGYYVMGWTNPPPGQYQLHAEAVDNAGGRGTSGWVQIVVTGTNQGPNAQTRTWTGADPSGYWSAPANWSPAGALVNGDALVFPGGLPPADMVSTNDLTDRIFRSITFSGASKHTIRGNPITLTSPADVILNTGTNVIACDLTFTGTPPTPTYGSPRIGSSSFNSGDLTVIGNVESGSLYIGLGFWRLIIMGQFTGTNLFMHWYATLALYGDNPYAVSAEVVGSTLLVQGSQPNLNMSLYYNLEDPSYRASLSGDGLVGDVADFGSSRITPDSTLSVKNISGGGSGPATLIIRLNGTNLGEYGRLVASGNVSLSQGSLLPSAGFHPQPGQVFTIVEKTSPGPISNAIFGPEGTITNLNGMPFRISYVGGDGNDVTLTATLPRLDIARTNPAQVRLSWPTNYPGFQLQRASAIDGSASWSNHPISRVVMGSNYTVTQPAATNQEFFRLQQ